MPPASTYAVFLLAGLTLLLIPGPAVLYVVGQSVDGGRRVGIVSVLGITTGTLVHISAAAAGLSALIVSSRVAFDAVRYAGAAYLIAIGLLRIVRRRGEETAPVRPTRDLRRAYTRGVVVNVLNPKTALFFLAFLPQFVDASRGRAWLQIVVLGLSFALLGMLSDGAYAVLAGTVAGRLRGSHRFELVQRWIPGTLFVGLGVFAGART